MSASDALLLADVTYRANTTLGQEVEIHLRLKEEAATVADAWARLSAGGAVIDPTSLEIQIRPLTFVTPHRRIAQAQPGR